MDKKEKIQVTFRYNKKFGYTEMFYYDDRKDMVCFCMQEGHSTCCYDYYLSLTPILDIEDNRDVQTIIKYYSSYPNAIELEIMKRLKR
jgi:hypothetical protein